MKKNLSYLLILLSSSYSFGQNWKLVSEAEAYPKAKSEYKEKRNQKIFKLDRKTLDDILINTSSFNKSKVGTIITIPNNNGELERFEIWESSNFSDKNQAKYPNIRSYRGKSLTDSSYIRFSTGPSGISSTILRNDGISEFLETYSNDGNYFEVHKKSLKKDFNCSTPELHPKKSEIEIIDNQNSPAFKTYRLALSVTGEYSQYFGGTVEKTLEAMNNTMTRVNGIYESQLAINFIFADDIEKLIYLDPETDPYSNYLQGMSYDNEYRHIYADVWNVELQRNLRDNFGEENYDIGHLFGHDGDGGNAGCIGCICETEFPLGKGSAYTSGIDGIPKGDTFDVDYVTHEIGHQLGANHTFSHRIERGNPTQTEPGSGSTIMGYAGITNYNVQDGSDDYFSHVSIKQIHDNLNTKSCGKNQQTSNTPPKIELLKSTYNIPVGTAFKLDAKITDNENDKVFVNWEQNDIGDITTIRANSRVRGNKVTGPNFRSFHPVNETYRYFPKFESILEGNLIRDVEREVEPITDDVTDDVPNIDGESLTNVPRKYNFRISARDNNTEAPLSNYRDVVVDVIDSTSPFQINSPSIDDKVVINADNLTITWDLGNTNLPPIETNQVKVSISWDGGQNFEELGIVENTGTANFPMPSNAKSIDNGYIMIEAVDNIFLAVKKFSTETLSTKDLNTKNITIYPNPSNGDFTIEQKASGKVIIEIVDLNGRVVYNYVDHATGNYKKHINTKLSTGVYTLKVSTTEGRSVSKIIIK